MALLPLLIKLADELSHEEQHPSHNPTHNYGRNVNYHEDVSLLNQYYTGYQRCPRFSELRSSSVDPSFFQKATIGKDGYQVCLDVQQFAPNEIAVKIVDNSIVVEAEHEERQDEQGFISRQFTRRYALPQGIDIKDAVSQLSSDGILTIKVPPKHQALDEGNVRVLEIQQTGPTRLNSGNKDEVKPKDDKEKKIETKDVKK